MIALDGCAARASLRIGQPALLTRTRPSQLGEIIIQSARVSLGCAELSIGIIDDRGSFAAAWMDPETGRAVARFLGTNRPTTYQVVVRPPDKGLCEATIDEVSE